MEEPPPIVEEETVPEQDDSPGPGKKVTPDVNRDGSFEDYVKNQNAILGLHLNKAVSITEDGPDIRILFNENNINYEYLRRKNSVVSLKTHANEFYGTEMNIRIDFSKQEVKTDKNNPGKPSIKNEAAVKDALNIFDGTILKTKAVKKE